MPRGRQNSFVLVTTLLLITLLIAVAAELASATGIGALVAVRRLNAVAHELAVDSALLVAAEGLRTTESEPHALLEALDRDGQVVRTFEMGDVRVRWSARDDGAKFNPRVLQRDDQAYLLIRKLRMWAQEMHFPAPKIWPRPLPRDMSDADRPRYLWFDQLFDDLQPGTLFRWSGEERSGPTAWSDVLTLWGDGRIAVRRVSPRILDVALEDIRPSLGRKILAQRRSGGGDFMQEALAAMDSEVRDRIAARLTYDAQRYAIDIDTTIDGDTRRWYAVVSMSDDDLTVLHRGPRTW